MLAGLCLYLFVRRRRGAAEGLLALTAIGTTAPIWVYFLEARPYGPMIGLTALAPALAWQRATDAETRRAGVAGRVRGGGVLGVATHYFFVVPLAGLAIAEAVRTVARRRLDRPVLAGFAAAGLVLAALYPLWGFGPEDVRPRVLGQGEVQPGGGRGRRRRAVPEGARRCRSCSPWRSGRWRGR